MRSSPLDHRYGLKEHPTYLDRYRSGQQTASDFQVLHRAHNVMKREMCRTCHVTGRRPPHLTIGFVEGGPALEGPHPCGRCYLAEPEKYRNAPGLPEWIENEVVTGDLVSDYLTVR